MSQDKERAVSLALTHARLHLAGELVRWAQTAHTKDVLPREEVEQLLDRLKALSDKAWRALRGDRY